MKYLPIQSDCCGCSACSQICPVSAIKMEANSKGFLVPMVNEDKCINCKRCEQVCPVLHSEEQIKNRLFAYEILNAKDLEVRKNSSSGGLFRLLGESVLSRGGIVFGAGFDNQFNIIHKAVENSVALQELCGSKYVQSSLNDTFKAVKTVLDTGREILFSGTACQIAGLMMFLGKDYPNLLTIDVLCHGVPSPLIWSKYVKKIKRTGNPKEVCFRDKSTGWRQYSFTIKQENELKSSKWYENDYMQLFIGNVSIRDSCFSCRFKDCYSKESDITLGDFWRADRLGYQNDDTGLSIVQIHSEKGLKELESILPQCNKYSNEVSFDEILPPTDDSRIPVKKDQYSELFFFIMEKKISWDMGLLLFKGLRKLSHLVHHRTKV